VKEGRDIPYSEIVKGYEVSEGSYVVLTKEEIAAAEGPEAHVVEIEHFVDREEIDPAYYERSYYLGPGKLGEDSYRLLQAALERSQRVGIGRFVFHNKAHLVAIRTTEDVIVLHTMRFADELGSGDELEPAQPEKQPSKLELDTAQLLLAQLDAKFEPESYANTYRDAVMAMIEKKAKGEAVEAPETLQVTPEGDLLSALEASLAERGGPRSKGAAKKRSRSTTPAAKAPKSPTPAGKATKRQAPDAPKRSTGSKRATAAAAPKRKRGED
jgi:DNA end-binding protein Ku